MNLQIFQLSKLNIFLYLFSIVVLLLAFTACEEKVSDFNLEEYPVVEAYLVTGKPVNSIRVFKMNNFMDSIVAGNAISGLQIILKVDSVEFILDEKADSLGYYYYAGTSSELLPGAFCQLYFEYRTIAKKNFMLINERALEKLEEIAALKKYTPGFENARLRTFGSPPGM